MISTLLMRNLVDRPTDGYVEIVDWIDEPSASQSDDTLRCRIMRLRDGNLATTGNLCPLDPQQLELLFPKCKGRTFAVVLPL